MIKHRIKGETWDLWWQGLSDEDAKFIQENDTYQFSLHVLTEDRLDKLAVAGMNPETVERLQKRVKANRYKELNLVLRKEEEEHLLSKEEDKEKELLADTTFKRSLVEEERIFNLKRSKRR